MADEEGTKNEERLRDLLGKANSKIEELDERLALLEEYGVADAAAEEVGSPPAVNLNQPQPNPVYPYGPSPAPFPAQTPGNLEGMGYVHLMYNPTTKDVQPMPVAASPVAAPPQPRQAAPQKPASKADKPAMSKKEYLEERWGKEFSSLADDLQFHNKMHPKVAEKLAADIVREAAQNDNLPEVLRARAKDDKAVQTVLKERIRLDAEVSGLTEAQIEDKANTSAAEEPEEGEPFEVETVFGTDKPLMEPEGERTSENTDALPAAPAKNTSTTPSTPPSTTDAAPSPTKVAQAVEDHIKAAFEM